MPLTYRRFSDQLPIPEGYHKDGNLTSEIMFWVFCTQKDHLEKEFKDTPFFSTLGTVVTVFMRV